jgi:hypothetical protein
MNELQKSLESKNYCNLQKIKEEIIGDHVYYGPIIWKILLGTVGLKPSNFEKDCVHSDIQYKLLFNCSFINYLIEYFQTADSQESPYKENDISNNYHLIIMDKVEKDKLIEFYSNCSTSNESLKSIGPQISYPIDDLNFLNKLQNNFLSALDQETMKKENIRLIYRHPLQINSKILHQIHIDIKRLNPGSLNIKGVNISYMYYNILVLVSHRRPTLGYIQGMADILVPFIVEFSKENLSTAESSAYFCYLKLLDRIQKYISGLQTDLIFLLNSQLEKIDPDIFSFLKQSKLEIHMFAFRWFNCLYIREFPYELYKKIFTTMLSYEKIGEFLIYFGVSLILKFKSELLKNGFSENIILLQTINEFNWTEESIEELLKSTSVYFKTIGGFL